MRLGFAAAIVFKKLLTPRYSLNAFSNTHPSGTLELAEARKNSLTCSIKKWNLTYTTQQGSRINRFAQASFVAYVWWLQLISRPRVMKLHHDKNRYNNCLCFCHQMQFLNRVAAENPRCIRSIHFCRFPPIRHSFPMKRININFPEIYFKVKKRMTVLMCFSLDLPICRCQYWLLLIEENFGKVKHNEWVM